MGYKAKIQDLRESSLRNNAVKGEGAVPTIVIIQVAWYDIKKT